VDQDRHEVGGEVTDLPTWVNPLTSSTELLPLIVGMDPGAEKGYALVDPDPRLLHQHRRPTIVAPSLLKIGTEIAHVLPSNAQGRPVWTMVELQYVERVTSGEISALSIVRLAFRAGFMLRDASAALGDRLMFAATPHDWKAMIFAGGSANVRKDIFTERLKRQLLPRERTLFASIKPDLVDDVLDAAGIAWALARALNKPDLLTKWLVTPQRMLPVPAKTVRKSTQFRKALVAEKQEKEQHK
jgi:hypothetical protein